MQTKAYPELDEQLFSETLESGLRVRVVPKRGFCTNYAALAVNYGGAHRRFRLDGETVETPAGVAHYLEHKAFDLPDGDNALALLSANGADPNAFTAAGVTCYYFQCAEHFEENLRLLLHFVTTPYFTEETVEKERGIIAQEIQMGEDSPGAAVYYNLLRQLYPGHPIRDKVAGTLESIREITAETLHACHRAFYHPANLCLCVEGDVDPERIVELAREALPPQPLEPARALFEPDGELAPAEAVHREQMSVSAPQFLIGAKLRPAEGGAAAQRQRLTAQLALRTLIGSSSPFFTGLYAAGLLNRDYDYEVDFAAGTGTLLIGGESPDPDAVLAALKAELARAADQGLDNARFERTKRASLGSRLRGLEDFESVCLALAEGVFEGFCALDAPLLLREISRAECEDFLRSLRPENLALSVIEPKKEEPCSLT